MKDAVRRTTDFFSKKFKDLPSLEPSFKFHAYQGPSGVLHADFEAICAGDDYPFTKKVVTLKELTESCVECFYQARLAIEGASIDLTMIMSEYFMLETLRDCADNLGKSEYAGMNFMSNYDSCEGRIFLDTSLAAELTGKLLNPQKILEEAGQKFQVYLKDQSHRISVHQAALDEAVNRSDWGMPATVANFSDSLDWELREQLQDQEVLVGFPKAYDKNFFKNNSAFRKLDITKRYFLRECVETFIVENPTGLVHVFPWGVAKLLRDHGFTHQWLNLEKPPSAETLEIVNSLFKPNLASEFSDLEKAYQAAQEF